MTNKLWDDVRNSLQEFGNLAAEKGREFSKAAADKAEELTRSGKLRLDLVQVNREIERLFSELGGKVYHLRSQKNLDQLQEDEEVQTLFEKISALEEKKDSLEQKLKDVHAAEKKTNREEQTEEATPETERSTTEQSEKKNAPKDSGEDPEGAQAK